MAIGSIGVGTLERCNVPTSDKTDVSTDGDQWPGRFTSLCDPDGDLSLFAVQMSGSLSTFSSALFVFSLVSLLLLLSSHFLLHLVSLTLSLALSKERHQGRHK